MSDNNKEKIEKFRNKIRLEIKSNIQAEKSHKSFKMVIHSASQGYDKNFFDNLECDRISRWGKF